MAPSCWSSVGSNAAWFWGSCRSGRSVWVAVPCAAPLWGLKGCIYWEKCFLQRAGSALSSAIHSAHCGLFPLQVQSSQSNHIDRYLACGKGYKDLRDAVGRAMIECKPVDLLEAEKVWHVLLTTTLSWFPDNQHWSFICWCWQCLFAVEMPGLPLLVEVAMAYPGRDANIYFFFIMCSGICNTEILLVASSLLLPL